MECEALQIEFPDRTCVLDQDEEWVLVTTPDGTERIRLHDYDRFFEIPGLYEEVLYKRLKCSSPVTVCGLLKEAVRSEDGPEKLRALDFGAGNGMVAECLEKTVPCETLVGVDIIEEAKEAALRDRPSLYDDYFVLDLCNPDEQARETLEKYDFNALVTVAALGYGDIPTKAFVNAFNLVRDGAWVAFNIKDRFLSDDDDSGFKDVISSMTGESFTVLQTQKYCHRFSLSGDPLHYVAIVGKKVGEAPPI